MLIFCGISLSFFNCKSSSARHAEILRTVWIRWLAVRKGVSLSKRFSLSQILARSPLPFDFHHSDQNRRNNQHLTNPLGICSSGTKNSCKF